MTRLAAVIASGTASVAAQPQCRAIGLNVAETLAVVALLGFGGARERAAVRFVARLFAFYRKLETKGPISRIVGGWEEAHTVVTEALGG